MKNFGMQHKVFLSILPFFVVFALIGSGFALFIFDNQETNNSANISITVENGYELGNIYLTSDTATFDSTSDVSTPNNQEKDDNSLSTTLFFDYKQLYFIRSDNITKERDFNIYYYNTSEESNDFSYSKVQLNLDISITSTVQKSSITTDSTNGYSYSTSAIDYIDLDSSSALTTYTTTSTDTSSGKETTTENTTSSKLSSSTSYSSDNKTATATYTLQTGLTSGTNYSIDLDLIYNSTLAPSADNNTAYFSEVISKMKTAITGSYSKIALKFYLTYNK